MNLQDYSTQAMTTLTNNHQYGDISAELMGQILGLVGESGEVADKVKKLIRDSEGQFTPESIAAILAELGDVLWYVNSIAVLLGSSLDDVAANNLAKLQSRKERQVIGGSGDER